MQFDPLAKRTKGGASSKAKAAAGAGGASSSKPQESLAEIDRLQHDLTQLLTDWEQGKGAWCVL